MDLTRRLPPGPFSYFARVAAFSRNARLLLVAAALGAVSTGVWSVLYNLYLIALGYDERMVGRLIAVATVGGVLAAFPAGMLSDRIGRRRTLILSTALVAPASLGMVVLGSLTPLLVCTFINGIGLALLFVVQEPFMMENSTPKERMYLFATAAVTVGLISLTGTALAGYLPGIIDQAAGGLSLALSYRYTLLAALAVSAPAIIPVWLMREPPRSRSSPARLRAALSETFTALQRSRQPLLRLMVPQALTGFGAGLFYPFINLYFVNGLGVSTQTYAWMATVALLSRYGATLASPPLARRWGKVRTIVWTELASIPFLLLMAAAPTIFLAAFALWVRGALMNMASPIHSTFAMEIVGADVRAASFSLVAGSWNAMLAVGAAIAGSIMVSAGYAFPYYLAAVIYVIGCATFFAFFRQTELKGRGAVVYPLQLGEEPGPNPETAPSS